MDEAMNEFGLRPVLRKSGAEPLQENGAAAGIKLLDFWQWSDTSRAERINVAALFICFLIRSIC
jgi:hypothetical protein